MRKIFTLLFILTGVLTVSAQNGGIFTSQTNQEFAKTISNRKVQLIDVRTPDEYNEGHIPGAINIDVQSKEFDAKIAQLKKRQAVAVYCKSGGRSKRAALKLSDAGFTPVFELSKGITGWDGAVVKEEKSKP